MLIKGIIFIVIIIIIVGVYVTFFAGPTDEDLEQAVTEMLQGNYESYNALVCDAEKIDPANPVNAPHTPVAAEATISVNCTIVEPLVSCAYVIGAERAVLEGTWENNLACGWSVQPWSMR